MDLFSSLVSHAKKPVGSGDSERKSEQGGDKTESKFLSSELVGSG